MSWKAKYEILADAAKKLENENSDLKSKIIYLQNENIRLSNENIGMKQTSQIVTNDYNKRSQNFAKEIGRLRQLLKDNNISIGDV